MLDGRHVTVMSVLVTLCCVCVLEGRNTPPVWGVPAGHDAIRTHPGVAPHRYSVLRLGERQGTRQGEDD